MKVIINNLLNL